MKALFLLLLTLLLAINIGSCWRRRRRRSPPPPPPRVNGGWSAWGGFGACTKSCGSGTKTQQRWCNNPPPANGGSYCAGSNVNTVSCNTHGCPVNGGWSAWGGFGACTKSCGSGTKTQQRWCNNPPPANGGSYCAGSNVNTVSCNTHGCPVHGVWSAWGAYGTCSKSCGGGTRTRPRQCANPAPANGGRNCPGPSSESKACNEHLCPDAPNSPVLVTPGGAKYQLVGCFNNRRNRFQNMTITERDRASKAWNGYWVDWKNWDDYMIAFINRCAQKVISNNRKVFGMSYFGECWSSAGVTSALELYTKDVSDFSKCVTDGYKQCQAGVNRCIGIDHGIAVYQIIEDYN